MKKSRPPRQPTTAKKKPRGPANANRSMLLPEQLSPLLKSVLLRLHTHDIPPEATAPEPCNQ